MDKGGKKDWQTTARNLSRRWVTRDQAYWWLRRAKAIASLPIRRDLSRLAALHGSDKFLSHYYTPHYQAHFASLRKKRLKILEIGIGGYEFPTHGGESLRMWKAYFPNSQIVGIDIADKSYHDENRIKTFRGSQDDREFLERVNREAGSFDIIIDDGSHRNDHVIKSFEILFPLLNPNGIYAVEDTQTAYWKGWGADNDQSQTSLAFFKSLTDGLNFEEYDDDHYQPTHFDRHIVGMHFYHNLVFVMKGLNNEGSNAKGKRFW